MVDLDRAEGVTEKCIPLEYNRREEEGPGKADPNNSKVSGCWLPWKLWRGRGLGGTCLLATDAVCTMYVYIRT